MLPNIFGPPTNNHLQELKPNGSQRFNRGTRNDSKLNHKTLSQTKAAPANRGGNSVLSVNGQSALDTGLSNEGTVDQANGKMGKRQSQVPSSFGDVETQDAQSGQGMVGALRGGSIPMRVKKHASSSVVNEEMIQMERGD